MSPDPVYLDQGVDYLGFLNAKLRDLRGWSTLINELVQNADDAEGATTLLIDITEQALVVENNGVFKGCESVEARECAWGGLPCDFHAFRRVASGHKRHERNTTGAFGIGFISVYQITDHPRLESGSLTWDMNPAEVETRRIQSRKRASPLNATRFTLPWAFDKTSIRERLAQAPVERATLVELPHTVADALRLAAPFLRRLTRLELRCSGRSVTTITCKRDASSQELRVASGNAVQLWRRLDAAFEDEAKLLRAHHGAAIEDKRSCRVSVLIPQGDLPSQGLLYAFLPTEHRIPLPFLINADFFPSSDRKRILFTDDYQGKWNNAAIRAAAKAVAIELPGLHTVLTPRELWHTIDAVRSQGSDTLRGTSDVPLGVFWSESRPVITSNPLGFTSNRQWHLPSTVRLLRWPDEEEDAIPALEALRIPIAHAEIREYWNALTACGARELTLEDILQAMNAQGLVNALPVDACPPWLRDAGIRNGLFNEVFRLLEKTAPSKRSSMDKAVRMLPLCLTRSRHLAPLSATRRPDADALELFGDIPGLYWLAPSSVDVVAVEPHVDPLSATDVEAWLATRTKDNAADSAHATRVITWVMSRAAKWEGDASFRKTLREAQIWPSRGQLRSLADLCIPGSFEDPLGLANLVDGPVVVQWGRKLRKLLHARVLDLPVYLKDLVPEAFSSEADFPGEAVRRQLVELIAEHLGELRDRPDIAKALSECPLVECVDGSFRPGREVYFDDPLVLDMLGDEVPIALRSASRPEAHRSALAWLGVASRPTSDAILQRVLDLAAGDVDGSSRTAIERLLRGLVAEWSAYSKDRGLAKLRDLSWLPARGSHQWHRPSSLYAIFREHLFSTVGPFLDVGRETQQGGTHLLAFLGVRREPTESMVVQHLVNLAAVGKQPNSEVYRFLSEVEEQSVLTPLRSISCLWSGDRYHHPHSVFLEPHPLGARRYTLDRDWLKYEPLLRALGVKAVPDTADARAVLLEVERDHAGHRALSDSDLSVVVSCWQIISDSLQRLDDQWFADLADSSVVPNSSRLLTPPSLLFFRDRPGLAEPFGSLLAKHIIDRPKGAASAMIKAGVRPLSEAVEIELLECDDPVVAQDIGVVLQARLPLIRRALESSLHSRLQQSELLAPTPYWSDRLIVRYRVFMGNRYFQTPEPHSVSAHFEPGTNRLYISRHARSWETVVARELAFATIPDASAAHLAATVEVILAAAEDAEAAARLDELGFAPADIKIEVPEPAPPLHAPDDFLEESVAPEESSVAPESGIDGSQTSQPDSQDEGKSTTRGPNKRAGDPLNRAPSVGSEPHGPSRTSGTRSAGGALRSYVVANDSLDTPDTMSEATRDRRSATDQAGIEAVISFEKNEGRDPRPMDHMHEGYDIESRNDQGLLDRLIEVKSLSGEWSGYGVGLSPSQFRCAQNHKSLFWLYVVERAGQSNERIHRIQDPASRVDEFRFDDGWEDVAETETVDRPRSILDIPNPERKQDN
jgi:hypothetical protein